MKLWEEFLKDTKSINWSGLGAKNTLNPKFWSDMRLDSSVEDQLILIADDFFSNLALVEGVEVEDVTITGSLANYNWSDLSDIDLHLLVDYTKIDENVDLVHEFFNGKVFKWNKTHKIMILGHEVEIYVQDVNESHISSGVYSLIAGYWVQKPSKIDPKIDFDDIKKKSLRLIDQIERTNDMFDDKEYEEVHEYGLKLKEKIKKFRQSGLEGTGEYSSENLAFKILRRNGYLGVLNDLVTLSYDKMRSLSHNFVKKLRIYVSKGQKEEISGFNRLNELEKFQKMVKRRHFRMKNRLIGLGKQGNVPPYSAKPSYERAKSAPPGAGGT